MVLELFLGAGIKDPFNRLRKYPFHVKFQKTSENWGALFLNNCSNLRKIYLWQILKEFCEQV